MNLEQKVIAIIQENIEGNEDVRLNDHLIQNLNIDSFSMLMIVNALEDAFSIEITDDEIREVQYVSDIVERLKCLTTV